MSDIRRQFETNVFGLVRMCQLVLPGMRRQRSGKIVNVSTMGANFTFPGGGFYHASKYAVEAVSDALRFEVAGFGVQVIVIQPGLIRTSFGETAVDSLGAATSADGPPAADGQAGDGQADDGPYAEFNASVAQSTKQVYEKGPAARLGGPPEAVASTIEKALKTRRPRTRYLVTPSARLLVGQRKLLSDRMWDRFLKTQFPQPH
jgi:NAD(P)-dependent dehydrogenase (short-subunit alcohol dehydrogenase family)